MAKISTQTTETPNLNIIGPGTTIQGDITSNGDIRIDGQLKGSISSRGRVVVGNSGIIEGEIIASNAEISGLVNGFIKVDGSLLMKANAQINGDIRLSKLQIEPGARFDGNCKMNDNSTQDLGNNEEQD